MAIDVIIVNTAYLLTFTALAVREIYWLRIILTLSQFLGCRKGVPNRKRYIN